MDNKPITLLLLMVLSKVEFIQLDGLQPILMDKVLDPKKLLFHWWIDH